MIRKLLTLLLVFVSFYMSHSPAIAKVVHIEGDIEHFRYLPVTSIPNGPRAEIRGNCETYVSEKNFRFNQSNLINEAGWAILAEQALANYKFIAFAGVLHSGTSGSCLIEQSNIAIYFKNELEGLIYLDNPKVPRIGNLVLVDAGYIRIFTGDYIQTPVAELHLTKNGLELRDRSLFSAHCNGKAILPDVIGKNILEARTILFEYGFSPSLTISDSIPNWRKGLINAGITEVAACSGTGFAFCRFNYQNNASNVGLVTAGEADIPTVVREMIECH